MKEFITKNKQELKKPMLYILVGVLVFFSGYAAGSLESPITLMLGLGCITFGVRDIIALVLKDYEF